MKYSISTRWGGYFTIWNETHPQFADRPRFAINPTSADVGIGTLFPNAGLEISRASSAQASNLSLSVGPGASSVGDGASLSFLHSGNERGYRIYERAMATHRGELRFASGNSTAGYDDRVVFDINGNVGIGMTTPAGKLHISQPGGGAYQRGSDIIIQRADAANTTGKISFVTNAGVDWRTMGNSIRCRCR